VSLIEVFLARVEERPDAPAIVDARGRTISYAELARDSARRAAAYAAQGIGEGDVVLVARGVSPALYGVLLALFRLGAVAMFPEPAAGLKGLDVAVEAARPKAVTLGPTAAALRPAVAALRALPALADPDDDTPSGDGLVSEGGEDSPALITFTSGSTGKPKGIVRSAGFLMLQHELLENLRRTSPDDVDLISLPVFILSNLAAGAASVIPEGKLTKPASLDGARLRRQIVERRVNRVVAPPAVCARLVEGAERPLGLKAIFTGGGPVFPNLLRRLRSAAPRVRIWAVYGSTEAEPIAHLEYDEIADADWRAMAEGGGLLAGKPIPEVSLEIRNSEIEVAGPHVNRGYLDPAQNASTKRLRDGVLWHRTGDAGRLDDQGRLWLLGRAEAAADGLFPFAVETAALSWPGVRQAALLAGEGRARLVVAGEGLDKADLARRAAALGVPELVELLAIPLDRRHNSKTDYARLRELLK
jgi:acyl-coenzyme A synthetase/AMP-(fatty) acid ligase